MFLPVFASVYVCVSVQLCICNVLKHEKRESVGSGKT